jgi:hypothetical protein
MAHWRVFSFVCKTRLGRWSKRYTWASHPPDRVHPGTIPTPSPHRLPTVSPPFEAWGSGGQTGGASVCHFGTARGVQSGRQKAEGTMRKGWAKPPTSQLQAIYLVAASHPQATPMRPSCDPHATLMRPSCDPHATPRPGESAVRPQLWFDTTRSLLSDM